MQYYKISTGERIHDLKNVDIIAIDETKDGDPIKLEVTPACLYCDDNELRKSEHFICGACGVGMCERCYNSDTDHTEHTYDFQETIEDDAVYHYIKNKTGCNYGYMCYACIYKLSEEYKKQ